MINKIKAYCKRIEIYLANASWIMAEKVTSMGLTFVVTIILARYLGPGQFGVLAYAISLASLYAVAGHVGLSGLVVRELVKEPESENTIIGTSFVLKGLGYLIGFTLLLIIAFITEPLGSDEFWVLLVVSFSLIFKPFDVIDFWFQSLLQAKYTAISRSVAAVISSSLKLLLVFLGAQLILFAVAHLIQAVIGTLLLIYFYVIKSKHKISDWKFSKQKTK